MSCVLPRPGSHKAVRARGGSKGTLESCESTPVSNGCETCLNTDLKLEHYSVEHSSSITSRLLARV